MKAGVNVGAGSVTWFVPSACGRPLVGVDHDVMLIRFEDHSTLYGDWALLEPIHLRIGTPLLNVELTMTSFDVALVGSVPAMNSAQVGAPSWSGSSAAAASQFA